MKVMIKGFADEDPPTEKKLPVDIDVVEECCKWGNRPGATAMERRIGDLILIAFYYLLRVGEYTCRLRNSRERTKKTVNFRLCDVAFFKRDKGGRLRIMPHNVSPEERLTADGATLRLTNQKNGWKNVCIHQQSNGVGLCDPVTTIARVVNDMLEFTSDGGEFLSAFHNEKTGTTQQVIPQDITKWLQAAAMKCDYPGNRGCPISRINTHSLRSGGANALSLAGYKEHQIQKMGRWNGKTFKEYISEQLSNFSEGMSEAMSRPNEYVNIASTFNFVNIAEDGQTTDVTERTVESEYDPPLVSDEEE